MNLGSHLATIIDKNIRKAPVIIRETSNRVRVKEFLISKDHDQWVVRRDNSIVEKFMNRKWAVAYAVALVTKNHYINTYLVENDRRISRLLIDRMLYDHHRAQAVKNKDDIKKSIIDCRISRAERDIGHLMDEATQVMRYQHI